MQSLSLIAMVVLLLYFPAPERNAPVTISAMWRLDKTFADAVHGVTFRYPGTWTMTRQSASYHSPALLDASQVTSAVAVAFSEGGFPRTRARGPYTRTTLEAVDVVYAALQLSDAAACEKLATEVSASSDETDKTLVFLNGIRYSVRTTGDAGMSQFISGRLYSSFVRGTCYLFETDTAGLGDGVDTKVRTLNKHDYDELETHLFTIMQTVHIVPPR